MTKRKFGDVRNFKIYELSDTGSKISELCWNCDISTKKMYKHENFATGRSPRIG